MSEASPLCVGTADDKFSFKLTQISDQQKDKTKLEATTLVKETSPAKLSKSKTLRTDLAD